MRPWYSAGSESRDDALGKVALDAAEARIAPIVKQAIQGIAVVGTKDRTAEACACRREALRAQGRQRGGPAHLLDRGT